jgi:hypothetical protein
VSERRPDMWKIAALLAWFPGLGVGLPCVYAICYFADHGVVWTFMGFPTYGGGPFEDVGIDTSVPLLLALLGVCLAELVLGWLLWGRRPGATSLALALLPIELAFWIGFDLPLGVLVGVLRTGLVVAAKWTDHRAVA